MQVKQHGSGQSPAPACEPQMALIDPAAESLSQTRLEGNSPKCMCMSVKWWKLHESNQVAAVASSSLHPNSNVD